MLTAEELRRIQNKRRDEFFNKSLKLIQKYARKTRAFVHQDYLVTG